MNILAWAKKKKQLTSQNVKQLVSSQLFVWLSMSLVSTNGMIWSKVISSLKVATSVATGLSKRKMVTQLTTLPLSSMTTTCRFPMLSVVMTTLPTHQNSSWFMRLLVGMHLSLVTWLWLSTLKRVKNCLNVTPIPFNLLKTTVRKAIFQKQSLTLSPFLVGIQVAKMKFSLVRNWLNSLMKIVSASHQLPLIRRN